MHSLALIDYLVILSYFLALIGIAAYFSRQQTTTEIYFVGGRSIPWWAMGISLMATLISSITFVAFPGDAFEKNWAGLVPGLMVPVVLLLMAAIIIPFYRQAVGLSAYEYFETRFGYAARLYSSGAFLLMQFCKMSMVLWLISLAISSMSDWNIYVVLIVLEIFTITYVVLGGIEAVIWTAVLQGAVLAAGGLACLAVLLFRPEGGPEAVLSLAWENNKFSLGGMSLSLQEPTFLVLSMYGLSVYIQKYATDQAVVQRYLVAKTNREALHGTLLGALLCIPVWAMFLLIGTCLWAYCQITGLTFPDHINKSDEIFPYFIVHELPTGLSGLVLAALIAAAIDADLNSMSVVIVEDYYRRLRPHATDAQRLFVGKLTIALIGIGTIGMAAVLASSQGTALSTAFVIASVVSGGVTGLFALAFLCPRATKIGAYVGIVAAVLFTGWATFTNKNLIDPWGFRYTLHPYLIGVFANLLLFCVGYVASLMTRQTIDARPLTIWGWLERKSSHGVIDGDQGRMGGQDGNTLQTSPTAE
jgi:SSS family solute:Na+ symporter